MRVMKRASLFLLPIARTERYRPIETRQEVLLRGNPPSYFLSDHLGSTTLTVGAGGNAVAKLHYTAWGEVRYTSGMTHLRYQFSGQYKARWHDPV
jgi:hypothetical protein